MILLLYFFISKGDEMWRNARRKDKTKRPEWTVQDDMNLQKNNISQSKLDMLLIWQQWKSCECKLVENKILVI